MLPTEAAWWRMAAGPVALPGSASSCSLVTCGMWDTAPTSHSCCGVGPLSVMGVSAGEASWCAREGLGHGKGGHHLSSDCLKFSVLIEQFTMIFHSPGLGGFPSLAGCGSHHVLVQHVFLLSIQRGNRLLSSLPHPLIKKGD